jgi:membrane-anchored protein YejM (alkaline phosphatase superfamily)
MSFSVSSQWKEVVESADHREYLRRFLKTNAADMPWNMYLDIDEMKSTLDPATRQQKLKDVYDKYFTSPGTGINYKRLLFRSALL